MVGKQSLFKPITFEDEALWYEEGYAMLKAHNSSPVLVAMRSTMQSNTIM
jgi:hypothetical protein